MYFDTKNYLKSNHNHNYTAKYSLKLCQGSQGARDKLGARGSTSKKKLK